MRANKVKITNKDGWNYFKRILEEFPKDDPNLICPDLTSMYILLPQDYDSINHLLHLMDEDCNKIFQENPDNERILRLAESRLQRFSWLIRSAPWICPEIGHIFGERLKVYTFKTKERE